MTKYNAVAGIVLPDPEDPFNAGAGTRYLMGQTFEASPPTRPMEVRGTKGIRRIDWLEWAVEVGVLSVVSDDEVTTPGRGATEAYPPVERLQDDGSYGPPEPSTEVLED